MSKITIKDKDIPEWMYSADTVHVATGPWDWGHTETNVTKKDGKYWQYTVRIHHDEGLQLEDVEAIEVVPTEKTIIEWISIKP